MIGILALAGLVAAAPLDKEALTLAIPASGHEWFSYVLGFPGWSGGAPTFLNEAGEAMADPAATMIICLGAADLLENHDLEQFVKAGGALLIATERPVPPGVRRALRVLVGAVPTGIEVRSSAPEDPANAFGGQAVCPLAAGNSGHPWFFRKGREVRPATNRPTVLEAVRRVDQAATLSGPIFFSNPLRNDAKLVAASAERGAGRAGLIGDTGILSNLMLQAPDNIPFMLNLIEWLREGREKPRSRLLLIVDGEPVSKPFLPPLAIPPVPLPKPEDLLDTLYKGAEGVVQGMEKGLADLDDRDALNQSAGSITSHGWTLFLGVLGTWAVVGIIIRFLAGSTARTRYAEIPAAKPPDEGSPSVWRRAGRYIRGVISKWRHSGRQAVGS